MSVEALTRRFVVPPIDITKCKECTFHQTYATLANIQESVTDGHTARRSPGSRETHKPTDGRFKAVKLSVHCCWARAREMNFAAAVKSCGVKVLWKVVQV